MSMPLIVNIPGAPDMARQLSSALGAEIAEMMFRRFPDGEHYIRFLTEPKARDVLLLVGLHPTESVLEPLIFAADAARELGARSVGIVAPYLSYMRQDKRFQSGEAITSKSFARLVSGICDWMVTVDPHLHRWHNLSEIYTVPTRVVTASSDIADWVRQSVEQPLIIGPDEESEQWAARVAKQVNAPYVVGQKQRFGDRDVELVVPDLSRYQEHTPVLVDDTISTATTMIKVCEQVRTQLKTPPVCCAVHGVFAGDAEQRLLNAGAEKIVTTNTIAHSANQIDVSRTIAMAVSQMFQSTADLDSA